MDADIERSIRYLSYIKNTCEQFIKYLEDTSLDKNKEEISNIIEYDKFISKNVDECMSFCIKKLPISYSTWLRQCKIKDLIDKYE